MWKVIYVTNYIDWELYKESRKVFILSICYFFFYPFYWFTTIKKKKKSHRLNHCFNLFIYTKVHQFRRNNLIYPIECIDRMNWHSRKCNICKQCISAEARGGNDLCDSMIKKCKGSIVFEISDLLRICDCQSFRIDQPPGRRKNSSTAFDSVID